MLIYMLQYAMDETFDTFFDCHLHIRRRWYDGKTFSNNSTQTAGIIVGYILFLVGEYLRLCTECKCSAHLCWCMWLFLHHFKFRLYLVDVVMNLSNLIRSSNQYSGGSASKNLSDKEHAGKCLDKHRKNQPWQLHWTAYRPLCWNSTPQTCVLYKNWVFKLRQVARTSLYWNFS